MPLRDGQQLRAGRSLAHGEFSRCQRRVVHHIGDRINHAAGVGRSELQREGDVLEVFKRRTEEEIEDSFIVGTPRTTPSLVQVDAVSPSVGFRADVPAVGGRVRAAVYGYREFGNDYFLPGIIAVGSVAIPLAVLVFLFE